MKRVRFLTAVFLLLLPLILTGPALLGRAAFVPADLLQHVAPWEQEKPAHAWNVLRFDGITQFYPWRLQAARDWRNGKLPLWNPNVFAADGGTPLWANSQSAPLYPLNTVFWLTPLKSFWYAFGLSAALHLLIAAAGAYKLARGIGLERPAALLSATTFTLSGPVVCWLSLPTFLCVSAWLPWLLLAVRRKNFVGIAILGGLALLGGHLQIGFYVILTALVYSLFFLKKSRPIPALGGILACLALAGLIAAPQVLPSVELSRISARASAGPPNIEGYKAYVHLALPIRSLVTFVFPDYHGSPLDGSHWNDSVFGGNNYAEWAGYVGVAPLLLALCALILPWKKSDIGLLAERRPLGLILALALLLALGTPLNALLYFGIPGFSQTGSPARVLIVASLMLALLAGIGAQLLSGPQISLAHRRRGVGLALAVLVFVAAIGASQSVGWAAEALPRIPFGKLLEGSFPGIQRGLLLLVVGFGLMFFLPGAGARTGYIAFGLTLLALLDLGIWGAGYNPMSSPGDVYPVTPGIRWLQTNARGALVAPLNVGWSMGSASPRSVLPPNGLSVYGLRDAAGYDSLFPADRKERLRVATGRDPSPPENGNMAFVKGFAEARAVGARFVVVPPGSEDTPTGLTLVYDGPDLRIYDTHGPALAPPPAPPPSMALRVGIFLGGLGLLSLAALVAERVLTRL